MNSFFYTSLAFDNIRKNRRLYLPYLLTCILSVMMYYICGSLAANDGLEQLYGGETVAAFLQLGRNVVGIFACIFLFYTHSFLMKRRKRELGLYNILGMDKWHLARVLLMETLLLFIGSLVVGCALGILFDKLMFLVLIHMLGAGIPMGFHIDGQMLLYSVGLYAIIFALLFLHALRQIQVAKPIELLHSDEEGEREPKSKWLRAILGVLCLGGGYVIAIYTENPLAAIYMFFIAVILVIIGTHLLFSATSIVLLKILRKKQRFYYQTKHFISISGMLYRMKQNAAGLANICILSTMVLVVISSTASLWIGTDSMVDNRCQREINIVTTPLSDRDDMDSLQAREAEIVKAQLQEHGYTASNEFSYRSLTFVANRNGTLLDTDRDSYGIFDVDDLVNVALITLADYNRIGMAPKSLQDGEVLLYVNRGSYDDDSLQLFDETFQVKEHLSSFSENGRLAAAVNATYYLVVSDEKVLERLDKKQQQAYGNAASDVQYLHHFDIAGSDAEKIAFADDLEQALWDGAMHVELDGRTKLQGEMRNLYSGFFFIGILLGTLFLMATILIIYYKQITEGYQDQRRFEIMQKVGLSLREIKQAIHSQVLLVFFLPLMLAGVHIAVAFPLISRILQMFMLNDTTLYIMVTIGSFAIFAFLYALVYMLTAKMYYTIVKR